MLRLFCFLFFSCFLFSSKAAGKSHTLIYIQKWTGVSRFIYGFFYFFLLVRPHHRYQHTFLPTHPDFFLYSISSRAYLTSLFRFNNPTEKYAWDEYGYMCVCSIEKKNEKKEEDDELNYWISLISHYYRKYNKKRRIIDKPSKCMFNVHTTKLNKMRRETRERKKLM